MVGVKENPKIRYFVDDYILRESFDIYDYFNKIIINDIQNFPLNYKKERFDIMGFWNLNHDAFQKVKLIYKEFYDVSNRKIKI